ncbi:MAG: enoyl-CoA hydratase/isomerase family protein [Lautropia sp.]
MTTQNPTPASPAAATPSASAGDAPPVQFEERAAAGGRRIGIARLDRPRQLNALDLDLCERLLARMRAWADDPAVVAVLLAGTGPKAFCAGGDVSRLVREIRAGGPHAFDFGDAFFTTEYTLDLLLHRYPKPLITWAHGITMGGGLGLSVAGSQRIVTPDIRIAMPEIHIGLFPDVGGGWFLNRVPGEAGLLMALTGVGLAAADAIYARLADYVLPHDRQAAFIDALAALDWGAGPTDWQAQTTRLCREFEAADGSAAPAAASALRQRYDLIRSICTRAKLSGVLKGLREAAQADAWFVQPLGNLEHGSPTAAAVTFEYLRRSRLLGIAEVLALDRTVARRCMRGHDFPEGVRALLIDKDKSPRWSPAALADVDAALVARHFEPFEAAA